MSDGLRCYVIRAIFVCSSGCATCCYAGVGFRPHCVQLIALDGGTRQGCSAPDLTEAAIRQSVAPLLRPQGRMAAALRRQLSLGHFYRLVRT